MKTSPRVLITDDNSDRRHALAQWMQSEGFEPIETADGNGALRTIEKGRADIVLLDLNIPGTSGLAVLEQARRIDPALPIILLAGHARSELADEADRHGAHALLTKPVNKDELVLALRRALDAPHRAISNGAGDTDRSLRWQMGSSGQIRQVVADIERVAPTDFTVVITGETGVGKELVAAAIHRLSRRHAGPYVPVDCGSIPPTLIESELFGHEKGAFTGADRARAGSFELAAGGTLFLDEIANLPLTMQAKLLRAVQERQIRRVGASGAIALEVRLIAASNEDLADMVGAGRFRQDLYYRLSEFGVVVPPLRERAEDIVWLANHFLEQTRRELEKPILEFSPPSIELLLNYDWPGNVRQLRNVVRRSVLLADRAIEPEHLNLPVPAPAGSAEPVADAVEEWNPTVSLKEVVRQSVQYTERRVLLRVLEHTGGNLAQAARLLRVDYKTLRTKARQYQLK